MISRTKLNSKTFNILNNMLIDLIQVETMLNICKQLCLELRTFMQRSRQCAQSSYEMICRANSDSDGNRSIKIKKNQ